MVKGVKKKEEAKHAEEPETLNRKQATFAFKDKQQAQNRNKNVLQQHAHGESIQVKENPGTSILKSIECFVVLRQIPWR